MAMGKLHRSVNVCSARLLFLLVLCSISYGAMAQCSVAESQALLKFKSLFLDPRDDLGTWGPSGGNCCGWRGVLCSRGGVGGIDLQLDTPIRGHTVTINESILGAPTKAAEALAMLKGLVIIRLNWVVWNAPFPTGPLSTLSLREIIMRNSGFTNLGGSSDLGKFSALETFVISSGRINTGFPSSICKLTNLKVLEVSSNLIRSVGPSCLGTLKTFQELRFPNNAISGSPPVWPANLPSLKVLDLSNNKLSGSIPEAYGKLSKVQLLLAGNNLSGRVPAALKGLPVSSFRPGNAGLCGAPLPNVCK